MIQAIDAFWKDFLSDIPSPRDDQDFIPFVRFNSSEHAKLRERGEGPYGAIQFLGTEPDFSRSARTGRIWKYVDTGKTKVRVDRYPFPVILNYQVSLYTERNERMNAIAQTEFSRKMRETLYARIDVDVFGDGALDNKLIHLVRGNAPYANTLDQSRRFQIDIPYAVEAWVYRHSATDHATFHKSATVSVGIIGRDVEPTANTVPEEEDVITVDI